MGRTGTEDLNLPFADRIGAWFCAGGSHRFERQHF